MSLDTTFFDKVFTPNKFFLEKYYNGKIHMSLN